MPKLIPILGAILDIAYNKNAEGLETARWYKAQLDTGMQVVDSETGSPLQWFLARSYEEAVLSNKGVLRKIRLAAES